MLSQDNPYVFVLGRVHPGECQSSYVVEGVLNFLARESEQRTRLLRRFNVVVLPMLNPDGVFLGNYRGDSLGQDLNRYSAQQSQTQKALLELLGEHRLFSVLDLHGHFGKTGFHGNCVQQSGFLGYLSQKLGYFQIQDCEVGFQQQKAGTGRTFWEQRFRLERCFVFEFSFFKLDVEVGFESLKEAGEQLMLGFGEFYGMEEEGRARYVELENGCKRYSDPCPSKY